jgi:hypothetical protein
MSNKVSNSGVVASDTSGVGTARYALTATDYGGDKALFFGGVPGPTARRCKQSNEPGETFK